MKKIVYLLMQIIKKSLWQEEEMHLLSANHDKVFHLLEPPPLLSPHEMKQHTKPNLLE
jgi:hypothetical protein